MFIIQRIKVSAKYKTIEGAKKYKLKVNEIKIEMGLLRMADWGAVEWMLIPQRIH